MLMHQMMQETQIDIDFSAYREADWIPVRDDRFPSAGHFDVRGDGVINRIPEDASDDDLYVVKDGVGFACRLLDGLQLRNGFAELELSLTGTAAPSIVFRGQVEGDRHTHIYSLVIFNHTQRTAGYQGINLWKWASTPWPSGAPTEGKWACIAHWRFPVPHEERITLGVDLNDSHVTAFFNGDPAGSVFDGDAYPAGHIGVCAIEGLSRFYRFSIRSYS
ncbi:MAG: hypothetical protein AAF492_00220 [Verrucomicrobiota bacterium]